MRNVICMKWGTLYGPEYVNKLYGMARRHITGEFRFVCLTDDATGIVEGVECRPLPAMDVGDVPSFSGWRKLSVFSPELDDMKGPTLFLDVDLIIVDNIDALFEYEPGEFCIIENWTQMGRNVGNSSVFRYEAGRYKEILDKYEANHDAIVRQWDNEQMYLTHEASPVKWWPEEWCKSFKHHAIPKGISMYFKVPEIPPGCKIVVFHGHPKPEEAAVGKWPGRPLKRVLPTPWINEHWR